MLILLNAHEIKSTSLHHGGDHAPIFQLQEKEDLAMRVNKGFIALTDHY